MFCVQVSQVAISWDNQLVLTSSRDQQLCVWQFATPARPLARLYIHSVPTLLKISLDKRTVVAVGARKNEPSRMMLFNLRNTFSDWEVWWYAIMSLDTHLLIDLINNNIILDTSFCLDYDDSCFLKNKNYVEQIMLFCHKYYPYLSTLC